MNKKLPNFKLFWQSTGLSLLLFMASFTNSNAQTFPAGFSKVTVGTGFAFFAVTSIDFSSDGRIFVAEKGGAIKVIKNGVTYTITTIPVSTTQERGVGGLSLHPNFAINGWFYVYYTMADGSANRLSRFTCAPNGGTTLVANSQVDLLTFDPLDGAAIHSSGAMRWKGGLLYLAVGDHFKFDPAQSKDVYIGKILRLNDDATPAAGNPFAADPGANRARKSIFALGLRNPFSMDIDPASGKIFIGDVGPDTREEINDITAGANFGWPVVTGFSNNAAYKNPIYDYARSLTTGNPAIGCAVSGGAFIPQTSTYPAAYKGKYFFTDWCAGWMNYIDATTGARTNFSNDVGNSTIGLKVGIDGNLYYAREGSIFKIVYTATQAPAITGNPQSISVITGQPASFSASASGAAPLVYQWQKNNVNIAGANGATYTIPSVAASSAGQYRCVISNGAGTAWTSQATLTVLPYNANPVAQITAPASGSNYGGGQTINYSGTGTDTEDGTLPASAFAWQVDFHHDAHVHPGPAIASGVKSGSFVIPTIGELATTVFYRVYLTVTDANGLKNTKYVDIVPRTSNVTLATQPAGLLVTMDGTPRTAPYAVAAVEGIETTIGVVQNQTLNGQSYEFSHWIHGGAAIQPMTVPVADATYTAVFVNTTKTLASTRDAHVRDGANAAVNYGAATVLETKLDA